MVEAVADHASPLWLFFAAGVGLFAFAIMPDYLDLISRVLIGWDIGVAVYLALAIWAAIVPTPNTFA